MSYSAWLSCLLVLIVASCPSRSLALEPADVFLLTNKNVPESRAVAEHYCLKRRVPPANILEFDLPIGEDISRKDYEERLVTPLRSALKDRKEKARVLLSIYGVPLRVGSQLPSAEEKTQLEQLRPEIAKQEKELKELGELIKALEAKPKDEVKGELEAKRRERDTASGRLPGLRGREQKLNHAESQACVDSELSLLWWEPYDLRRWQTNLLYWQVPETDRAKKPPTVLVARLDGPTPALAKRLVDQAVDVEQKGLAGKVYVDARGIKYDPKADPGFAYGGYDQALREMAALLEKDAKLTVTLDDKPELFASGTCPDCALYCGWYSLAKYQDSCRFVPGAVAYHIASAEAVSLRDAKSRYWCKCLLEDGVAATLGPVAEPYTIGFPKPAEFFGFLVTGEYTLVECYYKTLLLNSWMTVLVGDPLYKPFTRNPCLREEQIKPSPQGGQSFWRVGQEK